jgi:hypothetical protein
MTVRAIGRRVKREFLLANKTDKMILVGIIINLFVLAIFYVQNDSLRQQAGFSFRKILGIVSKIN